MGGFGRIEDAALVAGAGRYTADLTAGAAVARFVRSPVAHARIASLDLEAAREMPGVLAVYGPDDLETILVKQPGPIDTIVNQDGSVTSVPSRPALATDRVRFVGEAVAVVVAESAAEAVDAAEAAAAEYDDLPAASALDAASRCEPLHNGLPDNIGFDWQGGDAAAADLAFSAADHVVTARIRVPRILGLPLEPIASLASWDGAAERWTLVAPTQGAHRIRDELVGGYLGVAADRLRVITPDVGGAFGIRIHMLPEQAALLAAARLLDRPIAWIADRTESHLCEPHARDFAVEAELALDGEGRFLAVRASTLCALGAYVHPAARATPTASFLFGLQGPYRIPTVSVRVRGLYTNTTPTGPFRGAGQPEGAYVLERLVDDAARRLRMSSTDLRARNALAAEDFPRVAATGHAMESGEVAPLLRQASAWLAAQPGPGVGLRPRPPFGQSSTPACRAGSRGEGTLGVRSLPDGTGEGNDAEHREGSAAGRYEREPDEAGPNLIGRGLALYLKVNGMGRQERAEVAVDPATGGVSVRIGSQSNGQGHATTFAALAAERLSLDAAQIRVVQGDTDLVPFGTGTGASSALGTTGTGVARSCADLIQTAREAAADMLEVDGSSLVYEGGGFRAQGSNRFVTLREIAAERPDGLVGRSEVPVSLTYTVGAHACTVAVDAETGAVRLTAYAAFDDLGPLLQPAIAEGQIHGGVAQGVGQALLEAMSYDPDGSQPVTATLLDYGAPRADDLPAFSGAIAETPCGGTDLGIRGAGEAGAIASMAAVANAVADAVGADASLDAPLTPARVFGHLRSARLRSRRAVEPPSRDDRRPGVVAAEPVQEAAVQEG